MIDKEKKKQFKYIELTTNEYQTKHTKEKLNHQKNNIHKKITNNKQRKAIKQKVKSIKQETKNSNITIKQMC